MNKLYVANLPPEITPEHLREIFGADVTDIQIGLEERPPKKDEEPLRITYAVISFPSEKIATKNMHRLTGYVLEERRIAISPAELVKPKPLVAKQRKAFEEIAAKLQETDEKPLRMLEAIISLCGVGFAETVMQEAFEVEQIGGLMTKKADRRRTLGGVFFYLCRFRMSPAMRRIVYNRKGRMPEEGEGEDIAQPEAESA